MKDVEKTNVERNNSRKRTRRRSRWNNLYGLAVILIVLTVGITICYTFLFNLNEIRVSGESDMYSAEEIVAAAGIKKGDNLLRLDTEESEKQILDKLLYVETATISKKFPSSVEIKVTRCIPAYNVFYGEEEGETKGTLLVSKKGKILEDNGDSAAYTSNGLPVIYGYDPSVLTAGKLVSTKNEHKMEAFDDIISCLGTKGDCDITSVDMTDEFSIIITYKSGMIFRMGNWNDVEYKLNLAESVMQEESIKGKKGYLTMIGTNQCSFRVTDDPTVNTGSIPEQGDDATSDGSTPTGESNPDQEALFVEHNNPGGQTTTEPATEPQPDQGDYSGQDWNDDSGQNWEDGAGQNWDNSGY